MFTEEKPASPEEILETLQHFGVPGMKWGHRNARSQSRIGGVRLRSRYKRVSPLKLEQKPEFMHPAQRTPRQMYFGLHPKGVVGSTKANLKADHEIRKYRINKGKTYTSSFLKKHKKALIIGGTATAVAGAVVVGHILRSRGGPSGPGLMSAPQARNILLEEAQRQGISIKFK